MQASELSEKGMEMDTSHRRHALAMDRPQDESGCGTCGSPWIARPDGGRTIRHADSCNLSLSTSGRAHGGTITLHTLRSVTR
jgi:hypothetical protein